MHIAIASGKGGTGKTTIATSLAVSLSRQHSVQFLDCDVEAPNGHLFLKPTIHTQIQALVYIPEINPDMCTACSRCVQICEFHALARVGKKILVFPQLCHGCGSCTWNCPEAAITELPNPIGLLESGVTSAGIDFYQGLLTISEPMPTPIIRQLKHLAKKSKDAIVILDAPPGASCSVVETLRKSDFALLVTEPTPFGLHDLQQMVGIIKDLHITAGIIINRENGPFPKLEEFCRMNDLPVLMRIPFSRKIAEGISQGKLLIEIVPKFSESFLSLFDQIQSYLKSTAHDQNSKDEISK